jgi:hypothetical protein
MVAAPWVLTKTLPTITPQTPSTNVKDENLQRLRRYETS